MIRIRFHGRGGHGVKTASRILGTSAFLCGYQAQDSPVYGAERRGAAVVAFTRVGSDPIFERGVIERPDLIVLADESLLDTDAQVLAGQATASAMFVNTPDVSALARHAFVPPVVTLDLTTLTLDRLGSASALSAGLAAAAARMIGIVDREQLVSATHQELSYLRLDEDQIEKNVSVAAEVFAAITPVDIRPSDADLQTVMVSVDHSTPLLATPSVLHPGNAEARQTGSWRVERPMIDTDVCTRCGLCFVRCPDGAIALDEEGFPVIDYDHCKGCLICQQICPLRAIDSEKETRAW